LTKLLIFGIKILLKSNEEGENMLGILGIFILAFGLGASGYVWLVWGHPFLALAMVLACACVGFKLANMQDRKDRMKAR
jgi:hypothetical protein